MKLRDREAGATGYRPGGGRRSPAQRKAMFARMGADGELSSASGLLSNLRVPGGRFPGERVIREVRKGKGAERVIRYYGGEEERVPKRRIYEMARDRGFDLSERKFRYGSAETQAGMLERSLQWQARAKRRWTARLQTKLDSVKRPVKRARLERELARLEAAPVRSPLTGERPVSSYLRRYWS